MEVKTEALKKVLSMLTQKAGQPLDRRGLQNTADIIKGLDKKFKDLSGDYLYRNILRGIQTAEKEDKETVILRDLPLDILAKYLGHQNMPDLLNKIAPAIDPLLLTCEGVYYCYLRRNSEDAYILRSPVKIETQQGMMTFSLRGPARKYNGSVAFGNGCLYVLMMHEDGKQFHHIYQLGQHKKPQVLQGIFSGVSTIFAPIGGRTVLIRSDKEYDALENKEIEIATLKTSNDLQDRRLAEYFEYYHENNLNIKRVNTFRIDDLGTNK